MAAPHTSPSRFLKDSSAAGAGTNTYLALKIFSGQVFEAFTAKTAFWDNTGNIMASKIITGQGNSAQWPIIGQEMSAENTAGLGYHSPGQMLVDGEIKMQEKTITCDEILVSHVDVPFRDMATAHFSVLAPFASRLGTSIAVNLDKKLAIMGVKAAREGSEAGIHNGGNVVQRDDGVTGGGDAASIAAAYPNNSTGSGRFRDDVAALAQAMDEDDVPEDGRFLFVSPYIRTILRHEATSWGSNTGTPAASAITEMYGPAGNIYDPSLSSNSGDLNKRIVGELEGFNVILTTALPTADYTGAGASGPYVQVTKYDGKFDGRDDADKADGQNGYNATQAKANAMPAALALCGASNGSPALGMVQAAGLSSHMEEDHRRNTTFLKSQILMGAGTLCPWSAGVIGVYT